MSFLSQAPAYEDAADRGPSTLRGRPRRAPADHPAGAHDCPAPRAKGKGKRKGKGKDRPMNIDLKALRARLDGGG